MHACYHIDRNRKGKMQDAKRDQTLSMGRESGKRTRSRIREGSAEDARGEGGGATMKERIAELCDKFEAMLEAEELYFTTSTESFSSETWETWAELRELLTGRDCR
jgi:hypothetical protein